MLFLPSHNPRLIRDTVAWIPWMKASERYNELPRTRGAIYLHAIPSVLHETRGLGRHCLNFNTFDTLSYSIIFGMTSYLQRARGMEATDHKEERPRKRTKPGIRGTSTISQRPLERIPIWSKGWGKGI